MSANSSVPLVYENISEHNGTNDTPGLKGDSTTTKGFKVAAYVGAMVIAIIGNLFVVSAKKKDRRGKLRKFTYLAITSIAVSDFLMAAISIPERITRVLSEDQWLISGTGGEILCKAVNFVEKVSITVSALHVLALAFRRFLAVFTPRTSFTLKNYRKSVLVLVLMWVFAGLYWSPVLYYGGLLTIPKTGLVYCKVRYFYPEWRTSYLVFLILLLGILVLVLVFYSAIWFKLSCSKTLREQSTGITSLVRRKTTTMVAVIVTTFYCCFLPYWIGWIMCSYQQIFCSHTFTFISIYLTHASVAVNPFICLIFSRHYREALREILPFTTRKRGMKTQPRSAYAKAMMRGPADRYAI